MKFALNPFLFCLALILLISGLSHAESMNFKIGKQSGNEPISLFFDIYTPNWLDQETLKLDGKFFLTPLSLNILEQTTQVDQDSLPTKKRSIISFYLGGGINNINGGDLNQSIRSSNTRYSDLNALGNHIWNNTMHWKEIKWMSSLKGELIIDLFKRIGLGLGVEYIIRTNPRSSTFSKYGQREIGAAKEVGSFTWTTQGEHKLTVLPIMLNVYYFIPLNHVAKVFLTGGVGYYMGNLKYNEFERFNSLYILDFFTSSGDFDHSLREKKSDDVTSEYMVKSNAIGFQGGLGLEIKLSSSVSFIAGGNFRIVNFTKWEGNKKSTTNRTEKLEVHYGGLLIDESKTESTAYEGKLWSYEYQDRDVDRWYDVLGFYENGPGDRSYIRNSRDGKININGFALCVGAKIRF